MVDTANKRGSAIGFGLAIRLVLPIPDTLVEQPDRATVAYSYSGIPVGAPPPTIKFEFGIGDGIRLEQPHRAPRIYEPLLEILVPVVGVEYRSPLTVRVVGSVSVPVPVLTSELTIQPGIEVAMMGPSFTAAMEYRQISRDERIRQKEVERQSAPLRTRRGKLVKV